VFLILLLYFAKKRLKELLKNDDKEKNLKSEVLVNETKSSDKALPNLNRSHSGKIQKTSGSSKSRMKNKRDSKEYKADANSFNTVLLERYDEIEKKKLLKNDNMRSKLDVSEGKKNEENSGGGKIINKSDAGKGHEKHKMATSELMVKHNSKINGNKMEEKRQKNAK
jgi:hypothetical protein